MNDLNRLASQLMKLDDRIIACMKCGLCQAVCPMFGATMMEADVARGKLALVDNLAHKLISDPEAVADKLNRCLLCGSCQANCPSGVKIMDIFMEAREVVTAYVGLHPMKKIIFRTLLPNAKLFNLAMRIGAPCQGILFRKAQSPQGVSHAPLLSGIIGPRHIRSLAKKPLHITEGALDTPAGASGLKVAFFPGCMGDKIFTKMAEACLKVLRHHGVGVYMPTGFACCGIPALASGDATGLIKQMQVNLDLLRNKNFNYLITPCGSCTATIKELWPHYAERVNPSTADFARFLAAKTVDINEFIVDILKVAPVEGAPASKVKVTYHDSCHLKKSLGISSQPRTVVTLNPRYELVEMPEADRCCGCGGSFNLFHYDISRQIGQRKRDNVLSSNARIVSMGCPACMMQLEDVLSQNKDTVQVKHTVELYAETL